MTESIEWRQPRQSGQMSDYPHLRRPAVHRVLVAQLLMTLCLSLLLLSLSTTHALSALLGGLTCVVPSSYLVWKAFRYRGARSAQKIVQSFYQGEAGKFVLTCLAFVLIFTWVQSIEPVSLFTAFFLVQLMNWFTPLLIRQRRS